MKRLFGAAMLCLFLAVSVAQAATATRHATPQRKAAQRQAKRAQKKNAKPARKAANARRANRKGVAN